MGRIIEQWIIGSSLILKTENGKYYSDGGRGHYYELSEDEAKKRIKNL